jgi:hypothetical protein
MRQLAADNPPEFEQLPRCGNALGRKDTNGTKETGANKRNGKGARGKYGGKLNIRIITAGNPQAKGPVKRNRAVYRDRFVKEPGLAGISAIEEANRFLSQTCIPKTSAKFAKPPAGPRDAHVPLENGICAKYSALNTGVR